MANNFKQPPLQTDIKAENQTNGIAIEWSRWYNDIYLELSTKNHSKVSAAQALNLNSKYISLDSTSGAMAITLAAPLNPGMTKIIEMTVDGGDVTMSLANCIGGSAATTCTWNDVGDTLILKSRSDKWIVISPELGVALS